MSTDEFVLCEFFCSISERCSCFNGCQEMQSTVTDCLRSLMPAFGWLVSVLPSVSFLWCFFLSSCRALHWPTCWMSVELSVVSSLLGVTKAGKQMRGRRLLACSLLACL